MKRGLLLFAVLITGILLTACAPTPKVMEKPVVIETAEYFSENASVEPTLTEDAPAPSSIVKISASGFEPKTLTVKAGTTVTFINEDSNKHWPASAMHPTHKVYPGSGIEKCGTAEETNIFDACLGLAQGELFSFTFNEKGSWRYHDHLSVSLTGTIVVG